MNLVKVKKYALSVLGLLLLIGVLFGLWRLLFFGSATVVVRGDFNPITLDVFVENQRLYPAGEGGRDYTYRGRTGDKIVRVSGPFIEPKETTVQVNSFSTDKIELDLITRTPLEIGSALTPLGADETVDFVRIYGLEESWMLVAVNPNKAFVGKSYSVYRYITDWQQIDAGVKVDPYSNKYSGAPAELVNYLKSNAGD